MASSDLWNLDAENFLLAAILRNPKDFWTINDVGLSPEDFVGTDAKKIARAVMDVVAEKNAPDLPLVLESLRLSGNDSTCEFVGSLTSVPCSVPQALGYARTIKGLAVSRQLRMAGARIIELAQEKRSDYEAAVSGAETILRSITANLPEPERSTKPVDIIRRLKNAGTSDSVPIYFSPWLQNLTGGLHRGHFWVAGGFSGVGKSIFASNIIVDAIKARKKTVLISTEMPSEQYMVRMMSLLSGVPQAHIKDQVTVGIQEHEALAAAEKTLERSSLTVYDTLYRLSAIRAELKRIKETSGIDLVVIDFLNNVQGSSGDEIKDAREVALEFQAMAKELGCAVLTLAQISNAMAQQDIAEKGRGEYYAFRGSGSIKDAADVAIFLRRERRSQSSLFNVNVAKHRHGAVGEVDLHVDLQTGRLTEPPQEEYDDEDNES